jgi:hypothetical protein
MEFFPFLLFKTSKSINHDILSTKLVHEYSKCPIWYNIITWGNKLFDGTKVSYANWSVWLMCTWILPMVAKGKISLE